MSVTENVGIDDVVEESPVRIRPTARPPFNVDLGQCAEMIDQDYLLIRISPLLKELISIGLMLLTWLRGKRGVVYFMLEFKKIGVNGTYRFIKYRRSDEGEEYFVERLVPRQLHFLRTAVAKHLS